MRELSFHHHDQQFHPDSGEGIGIVVHPPKHQTQRQQPNLDRKEMSYHHRQSPSRLLTYCTHGIRRRIRANETCTRGKLAHPFETPISPHHCAHSHTHTHTHPQQLRKGGVRCYLGHQAESSAMGLSSSPSLGRDVRRARHAPRASLTAPVPGCRRLVAEEGETAERRRRGADASFFIFSL